MTKYPGVHVQLSGEDGNVFAIIGRITRALRRSGRSDAAEEFTNEAMKAKSYDEVLQLCIKIVNVS